MVNFTNCLFQEASEARALKRLLGMVLLFFIVLPGKAYAVPLSVQQRSILDRGEIITGLQRDESGGTLTVIGWIDAPPPLVWKALSHPSLQTQIYPSILHSSLETRSADGSEIQRATFDFPWPFDDRWSLHRTVKFPGRCALSWTRIDGTIKRNDGSWTLYQSEDGQRTLLYYQVFFDPGLSLLPDSLVQYGMRKEAPGIVIHLRRFLHKPTVEFLNIPSEMIGTCAVENKS